MHLRPARLAAVATLGVVLWGLALFLHVPLLVDEESHLTEIERWRHARTDSPGEVSQLPGYHAVIAGVSVLTGAASVRAFRLISFAIAMGSTIVFFAAARLINPESAVLKTCQYSALPILLPFD